MVINLVCALMLTCTTSPPKVQGINPGPSVDSIWDNPATVYDGYWAYGYWIPGMINNDTWYTPAPVHITGSATFYAPGVMRATANYRGMDLTGYLDGVAMMSPADIGRVVWLRRPGLDWEGPFLVVDCARRNDMYNVIVHRHEVVEVGFRTALGWGMVDGTAKSWKTLTWRLDGIEVWKGRYLPSSELMMPVVYKDWWLSMVEYATGWEKMPVHNEWPSPPAPNKGEKMQ